LFPRFVFNLCRCVSEHEFVIFGMYEALKTQCGECGLRFPEAGEQSRKHADWHFEINRRDKQRLERPSSCQWYAKPSDWTSNVDGVDAPLEEEMLARLFETSKPLTASTAGDSAGGAAGAHAIDAADDDDGDAAAAGGDAGVPSDDMRSVCPICSDKFEEFWSEADDQWMFRGAMYDAAGQIVHRKCLAAKLAASAE
jgi:pre-mRNA cleavage complex 2 protein Pcf11